MKRQNQQNEIQQPSSLPDEVAAQYELAPGIVSRFVCSEFGEVDLSKVTIEFAAKLADKGYLIKKV